MRKKTFLSNTLVDSWVKDNLFELDDEELVLSREWRLNNQRLSSRCRLNGLIINKDQLASLKPLLIDLTAQGQSQSFFSSRYQLFCVDTLGSVDLEVIIHAPPVPCKLTGTPFW